MTLAIDATSRQKGSAEASRAAGNLPGVFYGPENDPVAIAIPAITFEKLYRDAGRSTLIDFSVDGGTPTKVLIQDIQYDPVKGVATHVDFRGIKMGEKMTAKIHLNLVGEAPAVKLGGTMVTGNLELEVKCFPKDLVNHIDVDVTSLATFEDALFVKDVQLPSAEYELLAEPNGLIAKVTPPVSEEKLKAMEEENAKGVEAVEDAEEKKEDAPAEGGEEKKAE